MDVMECIEVVVTVCSKVTVYVATTTSTAFIMLAFTMLILAKVLSKFIFNCISRFQQFICHWEKNNIHSDFPIEKLEKRVFCKWTDKIVSNLLLEYI